MVILDPGHGVNTPGKHSPVWSDGTQLLEWEFNRDVVRRIEYRLTSMNIPCKILVPEARDIALKTRADRANAIYRQYPGSFGISVHGNASPEEITGKGHGWEVWTADEDKTKSKKIESDKLATITFNTAKAMLPNFRMRSDDSDGDPDKEGHLYITRNTLCPFILTENGFYDNETECRFMLSDFGRELIAKMHVFAVLSYLKLNSL